MVSVGSTIQSSRRYQDLLIVVAQSRPRRIVYRDVAEAGRSRGGESRTTARG
jgi:hypothetical protein